MHSSSLRYERTPAYVTRGVFSRSPLPSTCVTILPSREANWSTQIRNKFCSQQQEKWQSKTWLDWQHKRRGKRMLLKLVWEPNESVLLKQGICVTIMVIFASMNLTLTLTLVLHDYMVRWLNVCNSATGKRWFLRRFEQSCQLRAKQSGLIENIGSTRRVIFMQFFMLTRMKESWGN